MYILDRTGHLRHDDLERYHLGMIADEGELAPFEEHLLSCDDCARRAEEAADFVDALRVAACTLGLDEIAFESAAVESL